MNVDVWVLPINLRDPACEHFRRFRVVGATNVVVRGASRRGQDDKTGNQQGHSSSRHAHSIRLRSSCRGSTAKPVSPVPTHMSVPSERWVRVKAVVGAAIAVESSVRAAYVARACGGSEDLRREVAPLLAHTFPEPPGSDVLGVPAATDALIGRTVGTYRIAARVGAGGMGEVYEADDLKLNRPVALKVLPRHLAADIDRLRRFHAEAPAASSLNHPHILVIHDFGEIDGRPFIVTSSSKVRRCASDSSVARCRCSRRWRSRGGAGERRRSAEAR
jgi:hypothetical protein